MVVVSRLDLEENQRFVQRDLQALSMRGFRPPARIDDDFARLVASKGRLWLALDEDRLFSASHVLPLNLARDENRIDPVFWIRKALEIVVALGDFLCEALVADFARIPSAANVRPASR